MSLILRREGELTGLRLQCDLCQKVITNFNDALIIWNPLQDDFSQPFNVYDFLLACDQCERDREIRKNYPATMELDIALIYLGAGLGMDKKQLAVAFDRAVLLSELR